MTELLAERTATRFETFSNETLDDACGVAGELIATQWDFPTEADYLEHVALQDKLQRDVDLLERSDDAEIRARATATLRRLSQRFNEDSATRRIVTGSIDPTALGNPDLYEQLGRC